MGDNPWVAVTAGVALVTSLVAVASGVENFLLSARRKRQHETFTLFMDAEVSEPRREALDEARVRAAGFAVAAFWIPVSRMLWIIASAASFFGMGVYLMTALHDDPTMRTFGQGIVVFGTVVMAAFLFDMYRNRLQIVARYVASQAPVVRLRMTTRQERRIDWAVAVFGSFFWLLCAQWLGAVIRTGALPVTEIEVLTVAALAVAIPYARCWFIRTDHLKSFQQLFDEARDSTPPPPSSTAADEPHGGSD